MRICNTHFTLGAENIFTEALQSKNNRPFTKKKKGEKHLKVRLAGEV